MKLIPFLTCILVVLLSSVGVAQDASPAPAEKQIKVRVAGLVARSADYLLSANATLLDAITKAGGLQDDARIVEVRRKVAENDYRTVAHFKAKDVRDGTKNTALIDGDLIKITAGIYSLLRRHSTAPEPNHALQRTEAGGKLLFVVESVLASLCR